MTKRKVIQTLYSGLGGHASVAFSLVESDFGRRFANHLVFYGIEDVPLSYRGKLEKYGLSFSLIKKKPKTYLRPFQEFYNLLKREKPDAIIVHSSELIVPAWFYRKRHGTNLIYVEHEPNHVKTRFNWFLYGFAMKRADTVVCLNDSYKKELLARYGAKAQMKVIPNGINTDNYKRTRPIKNCKTLGMAARMTSVKDHVNLVRAFKQLIGDFPQLQLRIAGSGDTESAIRALIGRLELNDNVQMPGMLDEKELIGFLNGIDLYVHATLSETLSTSILQAMACELPVITSDIENNKLLINENIDGYFYENENVSSLYQKMKYVVDNFDEARQIGTTAREKVVENYSNRKMGESYLKLIEA